jgi:ribose 5-phosphate isomerase B
VKIYLGADHRGYEAKKNLYEYLKKTGREVSDDGDQSLNSEDDYPVFASRVAKDILTSKDKDSRGILLCGSGQGMCMAANRFKGIRAALGHDTDSIKAARNDDDANVLCLPAENYSDKSLEIVEAFLNTDFAAAPRFLRRIREMDEF